MIATQPPVQPPSPRLRDWSMAVLLYVLFFLPVAATLSFVDGALRGHWAFSTHEWGYQAGAFAAYFGGILLVAALPAIPLMMHLLATGRSRSRRANAAGGAVFAPPVILIAPSLFLLAAALAQGATWKSGLLLVFYSLGTVGGAALYGAVLGSVLWSRDLAEPCPAVDLGPR